MADDTDSAIMETAAKLGELVAKHPVIEKYTDAQEGLRKDPDASRLLQQFEQKAMVLARNEQYGQPVSEAEKQELETLQGQLASNIRVKAFSIAQADMTDLLRKVSQTWQKPVAAAQGEDEPATDGGGAGGGGGGGGPELVM